jgi:hypothetical protein
MSKLVTSSVAHPSSLVDNLVLNADGTVDGPGVGNLVAVKQTAITEPFTTSSTTFLDVTGLTVAITPSNESSLMLIVAELTGSGTANTTAVWSRLMRDSTAIGVGTDVGSRISIGSGFGFQPSGTVIPSQGVMVFFDAPNTSSEVTYAVQVRASAAGSIFINRGESDTNDGARFRSSSTLTVIEVKP